MGPNGWLLVLNPCQKNILWWDGTSLWVAYILYIQLVVIYHHNHHHRSGYRVRIDINNNRMIDDRSSSAFVALVENWVGLFYFNWIYNLAVQYVCIIIINVGLCEWMAVNIVKNIICRNVMQFSWDVFCKSPLQGVVV